MRSTAQKLFLLMMAGLLIACAEHKPTQMARTDKPARANNNVYVPQTTRPLGQWTVEDVLQDYASYSERKLKPYFARAQVPYPPREATLLALKAEKKLELWARGDGDYHFIRSYDIQAASGIAGPKLRQGDRQVPEGIYRILGLNPNSNYHLSMKLNYPNEFDLFHADQEGRFDPGSDIFIHGKAASIGCLAMGDEAIEELFVLTAQTGKDNMKVLIAPHDPRVSPLEASEDLPGWAGELYSMITSEVQALTHPVHVSRGGQTLQPRDSFNR